MQSGAFAAQIKEAVRFERASNALDTAPQLGDFKIAAEGVTCAALPHFITHGQPPVAEAAGVSECGAKAYQDYLRTRMAS